MKKLAFLLVVLSSVVFSQNNRSSNHIFIEVLGVGGEYSINYERLIDEDYSIRIGFTNWTNSFIGTGPYTAFPIMGTYSFGLGDGGSKLEIGLGIEYAKTNGNGVLHSQPIGWSINGASSLNYRYQSLNGSVVYRIGASQLFSTSSIVVIPGLSVGIMF